MGKNMSFNINNFERSIFSFTDRNEKLLFVRMPRKSVFDRMTEMQRLPDNTTFDDINDILNSLVAEILSNNKQGKEITAKEIANDYDFEEKLEIFNQYMEFVMGVQGNPN